MSELKPCPKCGCAVMGRVYGGPAAFGCGEYEYEVCCGCGIQWNDGPFDTAEEAMSEGARGWNWRNDNGD